MVNLAKINDELEKETEENYQLDESIIDKLPKGNTKQGLSERTKEAYKSAIRDYNEFLLDNGLSVSQESLRLYFSEMAGSWGLFM